MKCVLTSKQIADVDKFMMKKVPSKQLMENAAKSVRDYVCKNFSKTNVNIFCGVGNNGGDGFAIARLLKNEGFIVNTYYLGDISLGSKETKENFEKLDNAIKISEQKQLQEISKAKIVIDAIFGVGLNKNVEGLYKKVIEYINNENSYKIAVDLPSGLCADNGKIMGVAVKADVTITFQYKKIGHLLGHGKNICGKLKVVKIGDDTGCEILNQATVFEYEKSDFHLKKRQPDSNKGDYGKLLIVAGSYLMSGAACICAQSAAKSGVGLVNVASLKKVLDVIRQNLKEAVLTSLKSKNGVICHKNAKKIVGIQKSAIAIGPGLSDNTYKLVKKIVKNEKMPMVIDADGINAISKKLDILKHKKCNMILTPHLKEFSRLINVSVEDIKADSLYYGKKFAKDYNVTLLLKGASTLVVDASGIGVIITAGSSGMAKGGSGDVLTGVIGGLLAQNYDLFSSAITAAYICGKSGERASRKKGVFSAMPTDTIKSIHKVTKKAKLG